MDVHRTVSRDMLTAARLFARYPRRFSDASMVRMGTGLKKAVRNFVRIEIRRAKGVAGAAQVVAKGIEGDYRLIALTKLRRLEGFKESQMTIKFAGRSSMEFNVGGVNKGLPFRYLEYRFPQVLRQMRYAAGPLIDAAVSRSIIAADGDSTMFGGPTLKKIPTLAESPTMAPLNDYLAMGGIFMIISGNNLERTRMRLRGGIDRSFWNRFILVGNGGSSMAVFGKDGSLREITGYRMEGLRFQRRRRNVLNAIYIGNDGHPHGNDMEGFKEVGFDRSFLVEEEGAPIERHLQRRFIPGNEKAAAQLLKAINRMIRAAGREPKFGASTHERIMKELR